MTADELATLRAAKRIAEREAHEADPYASECAAQAYEALSRWLGAEVRPGMGRMLFQVGELS